MQHSALGTQQKNTQEQQSQTQCHSWTARLKRTKFRVGHGTLIPPNQRVEPEESIWDRLPTPCLCRSSSRLLQTFYKPLTNKGNPLRSEHELALQEEALKGATANWDKILDHTPEEGSQGRSWPVARFFITWEYHRPCIRCNLSGGGNRSKEP